ncbi:MAG: HU family DNA-binding protein [Actinomycetota bacterium]|nr:HU family DNA-binding protein [Actinomycetota bacterium]
MNRKELVNAVAAHTGMEPREVDKAMKGLTEVIEAVAAKGEQVTISGFAKFARVDRPARMARNPATGEPVKVKASKKAKITPLKGFKDAVMSPSAAPKLAKGVWPPGGKAAGTKAAPAKKTAPAKSSPAKSSPAKAGTKAPAKKSGTAGKAPAKKR